MTCLPGRITVNHQSHQSRVTCGDRWSPCTLRLSEQGRKRGRGARANTRVGCPDVQTRHSDSRQYDERPEPPAHAAPRGSLPRGRVDTITNRVGFTRHYSATHHHHQRGVLYRLAYAKSSSQPQTCLEKRGAKYQVRYAAKPRARPEFPCGDWEIQAGTSLVGRSMQVECRRMADRGQVRFKDGTRERV